MFRNRSLGGARRTRQAAGHLSRRDGAAHMEALEQRTLLFAWTPEEVYLLELVNRARSDPMAEGERLGLDLTEGLTEAELARLVPQEPLALNEFLTLAARAHSLDMAERGFFDHINPDGATPTERAQAAGYGGTAGENIAAGQESIDEAHAMWLESLGHRKNVFSLHASFSETFHYDEFGPGFAFTDIGPYFDYYTQMFGYQGSSPERFVLGVVFNDTSGDDFYTVGEGLANVRVDAALTADPNNVLATYTTDAAGNYQMALDPGDYTITFTDLNSGATFTRSITVGSVNVKVDAQADQFSSGAPGDDHANHPDFAHATNIPVDAFTGQGSALGVLTEGDNDLFRFTSTFTGRVQVTLNAGSTEGRLQVFNSDGLPVAVGSPTDDFDSSISFHVAQNQTYYLLVDSVTGGASSFAVLLAEVSDADSFDGAPVLSGDDDGNGLITLATLDERSHPVVIQQDATGAWNEYDLFAYAGGPDVSGDVEVFVDARDNLKYAVVKSDVGLILFRQSAEGEWSFRNLTAEITGADHIVSDLGVFTAVTGETFVSGLDADGDLVIYRQTGQTLAGGNHEWTYENLAENHLRAQGQEVPAFVGKLTSYVTSWNGLNIAGLDADGDIHVVWWAPGLEMWQHNNLTEQTGSTPLAGALTAYMTPWNGINLAGIDVNGKLSVTWWVPQFEGEWANNNLTDETNGPLLDPDTVASYVTGWGGLNVAGVDEDGDLQVYWWAPGMDAWETTNLSQVVIDAGFNDAQPLAANPTTGVTVASTGDINVFATEADGDIVRFRWEIGGWWQHQNVTNTLVL